MSRSCAWLVFVAAFLGLCIAPACGGGGGDGGVDTVQLVNVRWGTLVEGLYGSAYSDGVAFASSSVLVGDLADHTDMRGIYTFLLPTLPEGAEVVRADLATRVGGGGGGGNPFDDLGPMRVAHVEVGDELDGADYAGGTLAADLGIILLDYRDPGTLDVTAGVVSDYRVGAPHSSYRMSFPRGPDDGEQDRIALVANPEGTGLPTLRIEYGFP